MTASGWVSIRAWMEVESMFTPRQEKSTLFTPFCRVMRRSSSTRVASGLFSETTTRARSGRATSLTRASAIQTGTLSRERRHRRYLVFIDWMLTITSEQVHSSLSAKFIKRHFAHVYWTEIGGKCSRHEKVVDGTTTKVVLLW